MNRARLLFQLQETDSHLDRHRERLESIEVELADDSALQQARRRLEQAQESFNEQQRALEKARQAVRSQREKIQQEEKRLYSGKVTNPRELSDLQREVEALKRHLDTLEERQIEAMLAVDQAEETLRKAEKTLKAVEHEYQQRNQSLAEERDELQRHIEELLLSRANLCAEITPKDIKTYEALRAQKNGVAVSQVQEESCSACGSTLISATLQKARSHQNLTQCDTCGRILYAA